MLVVAAGIGVLLPAQAIGVPWASATGNPTSSFAAAETPVAVTGLTCTNNADKSVTISFTYAGATTPNSFDAMAGTNVVGTGPGTVQSVRVVGQSILSLGIPVNVAIRTNFGGTWTATSSTIAIKTALLSTNLSC